MYTERKNEREYEKHYMRVVSESKVQLFQSQEQTQPLLWGKHYSNLALAHYPVLWSCSHHIYRVHKLVGLRKNGFDFVNIPGYLWEGYVFPFKCVFFFSTSCPSGQTTLSPSLVTPREYSLRQYSNRAYVNSALLSGHNDWGGCRLQLLSSLSSVCQTCGDPQWQLMLGLTQV